MPGVEKDYQKTTDEDTSKDESDHIMVICKNKVCNTNHKESLVMPSIMGCADRNL